MSHTQIVHRTFVGGRIVAGTILLAKSLKYRMRLQSFTPRLSSTQHRELLDSTLNRQTYVASLGRAWLAWKYANIVPT